MDLVAVEEIKRLKHRYFRTLDLKLWEEFADCLAEDVSARYGTLAMGAPLHYDSRAEVVAFMERSLGPGIVTVHVAGHPEIDVDGDTATGSWVFEDTVLVPAAQAQIRGAGYYADSYRRDPDGRWRIAATRYERIYEASTSLADLPGFRLLANRWDSSLDH
ncbi:nuclear transport factor 2 family protein [Nocardia thailandica]|uniref:nuclear transport factor 2 family protein n=1 Tax=Nocardia thailandica TaxID=257275 RepID=UPI0002E88393|nr:nuclear transport factor 2 family protein [Nocardia thailandica]